MQATPSLRPSGPDPTSPQLPPTTAVNLGGAGKGLQAGHRGASGPGSALRRPSSNGHSAAAAAASTPTHCSPHSQQQRQEEASAQRKAAQEAGPPPLPAPSLPPRGRAVERMPF